MSRHLCAGLKHHFHHSGWWHRGVFGNIDGIAACRRCGGRCVVADRDDSRATRHLSHKQCHDRSRWLCRHRQPQLAHIPAWCNHTDRPGYTCDCPRATCCSNCRSPQQGCNCLMVATERRRLGDFIANSSRIFGWASGVNAASRWCHHIDTHLAPAQWHGLFLHRAGDQRGRFECRIGAIQRGATSPLIHG